MPNGGNGSVRNGRNFPTSFEVVDCVGIDADDARLIAAANVVALSASSLVLARVDALIATVIAYNRSGLRAGRDSKIFSHFVEQVTDRFVRVHCVDDVGKKPRQVQLRVGIANAHADQRGL